MADLSFKEGGDSPEFRRLFDDALDALDGLRSYLLRMNTVCKHLGSTGKDVIDASTSFVEALEQWNVTPYNPKSRDDKDDSGSRRSSGGTATISEDIGRAAVSSFLETYCEQLRILGSMEAEYCSSVREVFEKPVAQYLKGEIKRAKDMHRACVAKRDEHRAALKTFSSLKKGAERTTEKRLREELEQKERDFELSRFDTVWEVQRIQLQCNIAFVERVSQIYNMQLKLAETRVNQLKNIEPYVRGAEDFVKTSRESLVKSTTSHKTARDQLSQSLRAKRVQPIDPPTPTAPVRGSAPSKSGYLFKRTTSNRNVMVKKEWKRRWFQLEKNKLYYERSSKIGGVAEIDLLLCTVRADPADISLRFCFELVSPQRTWTLQAESEKEKQDWVAAMRRSIESKYYSLDTAPEGSSPPSFSLLDSSVRHRRSGSNISDYSDDSDEEVHSHPILDALGSVEGNRECADCSALDPDWASINNGVLVCIRCSGIHRSLGVRFSKVRSLTLDRDFQDNVELMELMKRVGNARFNKIYEGSFLVAAKPTPMASRDEREAFIREKYMRPTLPGNALSENLLIEGIMKKDLLTILKALFVGVDINARTGDEGQTALHIAAGQKSSMVVEFLLLNNADIEDCSKRGWSALHYACYFGQSAVVQLLLQRGATMHVMGKDGQTPYLVAQSQGHAHCERIIMSYVEKETI
eukprot:Rmarinus@m.16872